MKVSRGTRALAVNSGASVGLPHQKAENATFGELAGSLQNGGFCGRTPLTYWWDKYVPDFRKKSDNLPNRNLGSRPAFVLAFVCATLFAAMAAHAAQAAPLVTITSPANSAVTGRIRCPWVRRDRRRRP